MIHSNSYLGIHGQGLLNLSGHGDVIEAQRLILSLFYSIQVITHYGSNITESFSFLFRNVTAKFQCNVRLFFVAWSWFYPAWSLGECNKSRDVSREMTCFFYRCMILITFNFRAPRLNCDDEKCPIELLHPPEDCNINASLSFTLQVPHLSPSLFLRFSSF